MICIKDYSPPLALTFYMAFSNRFLCSLHLFFSTEFFCSINFSLKNLKVCETHRKNCWNPGIVWRLRV